MSLTADHVKESEVSIQHIKNKVSKYKVLLDLIYMIRFNSNLK